MTVASAFTAALILCVVLLGPIQARFEKPKFCVGKNGKHYLRGEHYDAKVKEACIRYTCVRKGQKLKMSKKIVPCIVEPEPSLKANVTVLEAKLEALQNSVESILVMMTALKSTSSQLEINMTSNMVAININKEGITTNKEDISVHEDSISSNTDVISSNQNNIYVNKDSCSAVQITVDKLKTCLGDVTSKECPISQNGKVAVIDAITENEDDIEALESLHDNTGCCTTLTTTSVTTSTTSTPPTTTRSTIATPAECSNDIKLEDQCMCSNATCGPNFICVNGTTCTPECSIDVKLEGQCMCSNVTCGAYFTCVNGTTCTPECSKDVKLEDQCMCSNATCAANFVCVNGTTCTTGTCPKVEAKIIVRDGADNSLMKYAAVSLKFSDGGMYSTEVLTDANGISLVTIADQRNGEYVAKVTKDNYTQDETPFSITCDVANCNLCSPSLLIVLVPIPQQAEVRLLLNWEAQPKVLDLHVLQINTTSTPTGLCHTSWEDMENCVGFIQNYDNYDGGDGGVEYFTMNIPSQTMQYVYMLYVDDFFTTKQLFLSKARVSIVSGIANDTITEEISKLSYNDEKYWLVGCLRFNAGKIIWKPQNLLTTLNPLSDTPHHCLTVFNITINEN